MTTGAPAGLGARLVRQLGRAGAPMIHLARGRGPPPSPPEAAAKRARGSGRIINVASVAAFANRGSYSAAKAWQVSVSRWANLAYAGRGGKVTAVCPGFTHTEFHDRMGMDKSVAPRWLWLQAERVVR